MGRHIQEVSNHISPLTLCCRLCKCGFIVNYISDINVCFQALIKESGIGPIKTLPEVSITQ